MTKPAQVASLANFAHAELGSIDLWWACGDCTKHETFLWNEITM